MLILMSRNLSSKSLTPLPWHDFYTQEFYYTRIINNYQSITHHVYLTPPTKSGPLFVTHHGAGSSGLSFAVLAKEISKSLPDAGFLSFDARAHGLTTVTAKKDSDDTTLDLSEDGSMDLKLDTLSNDMAHVIRETKARMNWSPGPDLVLVGHSLGGAVVTDVAKNQDVGMKIVGFAVLDVVEGTLALSWLGNCLS